MTAGRWKRTGAAGRRRSPTACSGATAHLYAAAYRFLATLPLPSPACAQGDGGAIEMQVNTGRVAISDCAFDANSANTVRLSPRGPPVCSLACLQLTGGGAGRRCASPVAQHGGFGRQLQLRRQRGPQRRTREPAPRLRLWPSPQPLRACRAAAPPCLWGPAAPSSARCWRTAAATATTTAAAALWTGRTATAA